MTTIETLLEYMAMYGGSIISTNSLDPYWIEQARASGRLYVNDFSLGYVWEPPQSNEFPDTEEKVELFEKWYPLNVPLPKELETLDWLHKKHTPKNK